MRLLLIVCMLFSVTGCRLLDGRVVDAAFDGNARRLKFLLNIGAKPDIKVYGGDLFVEIFEFSSAPIEVKAVLLEHGADVNAVDGGKHTAMFRAIEFGSEKEVRFLAGKGANLNAEGDSGYTPLLQAIALRRPLSLVQALVELGAHPCQESKKLKTVPAQFAREKNAADAAAFLGERCKVQ